MDPQPDPAPAAIRFTPRLPPRRLSVDTILSMGHSLLKLRWGLITGVFAVAIVIQWLVALVVSLIDFALFGRDAVFAPFTTLSNILFGSAINIGPIYAALRIYRGESADFSDLWIGFTRWSRVVVIGLVIQVAGIASSVSISVTINYATSNAGTPLLAIAGAVASLVAILVAIFVSVRLYFAALLCVDPAGPRPDIAECLALSWRLTSGHTLKLLLVAIVIGIIAMATLACVFVPFFLYGGPVSVACAAIAYALACHESGLVPLAAYGDECPHCGYDLSMTDGSLCPECGRHVPRSAEQAPPDPVS